MLATQRKTEYACAPLPKKRVVKMEGNVAYIGTGSSKSQKTFRGERTGYPENESARKKNVAKNNVAKNNAVKKNAAKKNAAKKIQAAAPAAQPERLHRGMASTITVIFLAFCALALLVSRYAAICTINSENNELKREIDAVKVKTEELRVQMELRDNLENVLDTAVNGLGMKYPGQEQKVYLDMS